ncbi:acyltransferase [Candidatus Woesebacteria bacterium]|nr:acyltransferase [Candidatus Woesebacteria bacterium]
MKSLFEAIQDKGIVEVLTRTCLLVVGLLRSYATVSWFRGRGYAFDSSLYLGGANQFFQSKKNHITVEKNSRFGKHTRVDAGFDGKIVIGKNVLVDDHCFITAQKSITIGNNVMIAAYSFITDFNHAFRSKKTHIDQQGFERNLVVIEDDVWIGTHVCILKGVTIGRGAVIGAGSVVTKNIKPYEVVAGNPAKHIRYRT